MSSATKIPVLLPVETINRELDFRLFLANKFANAHNRIYIGQHDLIFRMAAHIKRGLWIGKNIFALFPQTEMTRYNTLKENDFSIVHLDEEGAVYPGDAEGWSRFLRLRLDPTCLEKDDHVCTWGDFQRDFYKAQDPACASNIVTTGHPRFDLYKPNYRGYYAADAAKIRERFGDFLLVNTNLTYANNGLGLGDTFSRRYGYDPANDDTRLYYVNMWAHASQTLARYVRLINRLSIEFPTLNIVIRPHPSEDRQFYSTIFQDIKNVHVVHEGSVAPWLLACRVMIHDGCTTGIEAYLADTNIINYKSLVDTTHDLFLPNIFGVKLFGEDEVIDTTRSMLAAAQPSPPPAEFNDMAYSLMDNFRHDTFQQLLAILEKVEGEIDLGKGQFDEAGFWRGEQVQGVKNRAKAAIRPLMPHKLRDFKLYQSHFYGLDAASIGQKLDTIQRITGKPVKFQAHSEALISIEAA